MLKYSVIIPVYNVKEYLSDCIDSVLAQSIPDYEVILVNDGSTDGSGELCDQYAEKYPQILAIHQQNQGVSVARNTGLEKATGEYVLFLDSDDWWEPNLLELLNEKYRYGFCYEISRKETQFPLLCDFCMGSTPKKLPGCRSHINRIPALLLIFVMMPWQSSCPIFAKN